MLVLVDCCRRLLRFAVLLIVVTECISLRTPADIAEHLAAREQILSGRDRRQTVPEITVTVTAPLFSSRLFEYGIAHGDTELARSLDVGKQITLSTNITLFGESFNSVYILSNGAIGFDASARSYRANLFPGGQRLIAAFWNRNDLKNGGHVYYREMTGGRVVDRGQSEIRYQYDKNVKVLSVLIVTWEAMQPLGSAALPAENTNTFQAAIFMTDDGTFANFIYNNIGWTQGAEAGFNKGDGKEYFALPTSGTGNIMYLEEYGNTGIPGEWMFEIGRESIIRCKVGIKGDTCDENCLPNEWGVDCAKCCHCVGDDRCNATSGACASGQCDECWSGAPTCQQRDQTCRVRAEGCAHNAISFTDYDRCGEPLQRCQCLAGYSGDGRVACNDIDECTQTTTCHTDAICTNTPGRYFCQCQSGFSGDGVNECKASFLYPHEKHQTLPKSKNAKVAWQLRYPLAIFGRIRSRITISTNGLIVMDEVAKLNVNQRLEHIGVQAIAPFFAPTIDISHSGTVSVDETTDSDVLTRATHTIVDNYDDTSFVAKSVVIITYTNVTTGPGRPANTFQANLIGGTNAIKQNVTFVELLYRDLPWTDGAEAGIMFDDVSDSILLPGSGTDGIEQLTKLSNIRSPGIWLYRIDSDTVLPCTQPTLQPPYCDSDVSDIAGTAPSNNGNRNRPTIKSTTTTVTTTPTPTPSTAATRASSTPLAQTPPSPTPNTPAPTATPSSHKKARPSFPSSTDTILRRPQLPPIDDENDKDVFESDDESTPDNDYIEVTFPPFITVIPSLFTAGAGKNAIQPGERIQPSLSRISVEPLPSAAVDQHRHRSKLDHTAEATASSPEDDVESSATDKPRPVFPPTDRTPPPVQRNILPIVTPTSPESALFTRIDTTPSAPIEIDDNNIVAVTEPANRPIFIFTTPKRITRLPVPTRAPKPVIVTGTTPSHRNNNNNVHLQDTHRQGITDDSPNKLAIIIPASIVCVWLLLLLIIGLVVCCRKRQTRRHIRTMYGPSYHVRHHMPTNGHQGYGGGGRSKSKGGVTSSSGVTAAAMHGSYEDHLEKAARLSSELSSYNQNGRISLYGSYWNLANSGSSPSNTPNTTGVQQQAPPLPPTSRVTNQGAYCNQRYTYNARY